MTASATSQLPAHAALLARLAHAVRREQVPLVLSVAAIGIHIADDNLVQPEPGTSVADHLASGLVPLALALAAGVAIVSVRFRPGIRATFAQLLGVSASSPARRPPTTRRRGRYRATTTPESSRSSAASCCSVPAP
jgi:hypothetical protein